MATTKTSKTPKKSSAKAAKSAPTAGVEKTATRGTKEYQKTPLLTKEQAEDGRKWWVADVSGKTLGRAATTIAHVLRGKHKASYTPHVDSGDFVIVINADKVKLTGNKVDGKIYYEHTLYPGGIKATPAGKMLQRHPEELMLRAVWGMLPKGPLGRRIYKKLKVYAKATHDHVAQQPEVLELPNG